MPLVAISTSLTAVADPVARIGTVAVALALEGAKSAEAQDAAARALIDSLTQHLAQPQRTLADGALLYLALLRLHTEAAGSHLAPITKRALDAIDQTERTALALAARALVPSLQRA